MSTKTNNPLQAAYLLISLVLMGTISGSSLADGKLNAEVLLEIEQQLEDQNQSAVADEAAIRQKPQAEEVQSIDEVAELATTDQNTKLSANRTTTSADNTDDSERVAPNYAQTKKDSIERMQRIKQAFETN